MTTAPSDIVELVKRLRETHPADAGSYGSAIREEAADRLEAQQAELASLEAYSGQMSGALRDAKAEIERLSTPSPVAPWQGVETAPIRRVPVIAVFSEKYDREVEWAVLTEDGWYAANPDGSPINGCPAPVMWCYSPLPLPPSPPDAKSEIVSPSKGVTEEELAQVIYEAVCASTDPGVSAWYRSIDRPEFLVAARAVLELFGKSEKLKPSSPAASQKEGSPASPIACENNGGDADHPRSELQEALDFLDKIEGSGYGGMAEFEIARRGLQVALSRFSGGNNAANEIGIDTARPRDGSAALRAQGGACPCCNRTFADMARHMKTKHPDFDPNKVVDIATAKKKA